MPATESAAGMGADIVVAGSAGVAGGMAVETGTMVLFSRGETGNAVPLGEATAGIGHVSPEPLQDGAAITVNFPEAIADWVIPLTVTR